MRTTWEVIKGKAQKFAAAWAKGVNADVGEVSEKQTFYNEFFEIFGVKRRSVGRYEHHVRKLNNKHGYIDLFWPGVLLVEHKSPGASLVDAFDQASEYCDALRQSEHPRFIMACDFRKFELFDCEQRTVVKFDLEQLPDHVESFGFILGIEKRPFRDQDPVSIEASVLVGDLYDALDRAGYPHSRLDKYLIRLVFCMFADDTGIFSPRDIFLDMLENNTKDDGSDVGSMISTLFQALNTPENERMSTQKDDFKSFPYVNGDLFVDTLPIADFDAKMRTRLIAACQFDWSGISPAIFGALFQSVMDKQTRREKGAHYTSERNILKVIEPLFLDDLRAELAKLMKSRANNKLTKLRGFQERLSKMNFIDPACGCGNFLIIAYRELRLLEIDILKAIRLQDNKGAQAALDPSFLSLIDVDQFYGIEIEDFPHRIAQTALWMMDHIMNNRLSMELSESYVRIPLEKAPKIINADALEIDWAKVLDPAQCSYILGNPPFVGSKMQSVIQRRQLMLLVGSSNSLDYVAAWFFKAAEYMSDSACIGFVATSSLTQGQQVAQIWPTLLSTHGLKISFAHSAFKWDSDARGIAQVHVVIVGLAKESGKKKPCILFSYEGEDSKPEVKKCTSISPYLIDATRMANPNLVVKESKMGPINCLPQLIIGSKPIDNGLYVFDDEERKAFLLLEPGARKLFRKFMGADEFLHSKGRWILALQDARPEQLHGLPAVRQRMAAVSKFRLQSRSEPTRKLASFPAQYHVNVLPKRSYLAIPESTSELRDYVPMGWLPRSVVPSNALRLSEVAELWHFALLNSSMHMAWLRSIGGRFGSGYRYSICLVYNTFPMPDISSAMKRKLAQLAQTVLDARKEQPGATLAMLYDSVTMPPKLRRAHSALDRVVDKLYRKQGFSFEHERIEHLLGMYEESANPLAAQKSSRKGSKLARRAHGGS